MPKSERQKGKLLVLERMLLESTDEQHPMSTQRLIEALARQNITAERKSIYSDMRVLREFGLDVQGRKGADPGWFIGGRLFELPELKLLVDAVQASRFITRRKSEVLIRKLSSLASVHEARQLRRQVHVDRRVKTMNESVYYSIDKLHAAIAAGCEVKFFYFEYDVGKNKVFRRGGRPYEVTPYGLIWDNQNYYLAGWDHAHGEMRHYRVDKMARIEITRKKRPDGAGKEPFDPARYAQKHFGMYSGREAQVTLRCENSLAGVVIDRFGRDVMLIPDGAEHFTVSERAVVSPPFWGWLFGLGGAVVIKAPDYVRREYLAWISTVCGAYGGKGRAAPRAKRKAQGIARRYR